MKNLPKGRRSISIPARVFPRHSAGTTISARFSSWRFRLAAAYCSSYPASCGQNKTVLFFIFGFFFFFFFLFFVRFCFGWWECDTKKRCAWPWEGEGWFWRVKKERKHPPYHKKRFFFFHDDAGY